MTIRIGDEAPNFTAETTQGEINFHQWIGDGWALLFSHPKDFTPVCTTELRYVAGMQTEFSKPRKCLDFERHYVGHGNVNINLINPIFS